MAVMGAIRGDEVQQMYTAARLVKRLKDLETMGAFSPDCGILVIPCAGQFSMNVNRRFWPLDHTDINRMFPGYDAGETTQRLADKIFTALQGYQWGVHLCSSSLPGDVVPHVRVIHTGLQPDEEGLDFGLPYLVTRQPYPYDTTTLNYNWQVWETHTFSIFTSATNTIDKKGAELAADGILRFLVKRGMLDSGAVGCETENNTVKGEASGKTYGIVNKKRIPDAVVTEEFEESRLLNVHNKKGGLLMRHRNPGNVVKKGDILAEVTDPYTTEAKETITAPCNGVLFFAHLPKLISGRSIVFRLLPDGTGK